MIRLRRSHLSDFSPRTTLLCYSLCCDEISSTIPTAFGKHFKNGKGGGGFQLGGLSGFPFGGLTGVGAFYSHIRKADSDSDSDSMGKAIVVHASHTGVSLTGHVGKTQRLNQKGPSATCGSSCAAYNACIKGLEENPEFYAEVSSGSGSGSGSGNETIGDQQQEFVLRSVAKHAAKCRDSEDPMASLAISVAEEVQGRVDEILFPGGFDQSQVDESAAAKAVQPPPFDTAVVGGLHINTPPGMEDYFLLRRLDVVRTDGRRTNLMKTVGPS